MKKKVLSFSLTKTVQIKEYEPLKIYAGASAELEKGDTVRGAYRELQKDCEDQITRYYKTIFPKKKQKKRLLK